MFRKFSWQQQTNGCLYFSACNSGTLVVMSKTRGFGSKTFEYIVHKAVHNRHSFTGNTGIGMNLLQNLVDVNTETFLPLLFPFKFLSPGRGALSAFFIALPIGIAGIIT
ncbi:hypothetical protein CEXT_359141 [Caerostris extrusa]|uniref:Uncharacterized protein n=1 Tax=Caerostris extrusa TaxID=172846 RepID=A0AAV4XS55_CAEEX|nr:hypothetical protein CEXT_359141 [Caerostris extrusa]